MIRIGICDDDSRARDALRWKLERLLEEEQEQIIYDFSSGTGVVQWLQKHPGQMDLLFLDVEMEPCTGLEAARQIRQFNGSLLIVFVTGFADFVFEGYQVRALDYLLKPCLLYTSLWFFLSREPDYTESGAGGNKKVWYII